jgi:hypothetical protein
MKWQFTVFHVFETAIRVFHIDENATATPAGYL